MYFMREKYIFKNINKMNKFIWFLCKFNIFIKNLYFLYLSNPNKEDNGNKSSKIILHKR